VFSAKGAALFKAWGIAPGIGIDAAPLALNTHYRIGPKSYINLTEGSKIALTGGLSPCEAARDFICEQQPNQTAKA